MDVDTARAILNEAKEGDFYAKALPENTGELLNEAMYFAEEAELAFEQGWGQKNAHIVAIVNLAKLTQNGSVSHESNNGREVPPKGSDNSSSEQIAKQSHEKVKGGGIAPLHPLERLVEAEHLPLPSDIDDTSVEMPTDITAVNDLKIRKLYSEFNALANRANWLLARATSDLNDAMHLRDDAYRKAYAGLDRLDEDTNKNKTTAQLENEAKSDNTYARYAEDAVTHTNAAVAWKALKEIYSGNVERLSREMTFRQQEWEKGR